MTADGTRENPVYMRFMDAEVSPGKFILMTAVTLAPVAIAILMQKPALRQAITMRLWNTATVVSIRQSEFWLAIAAKTERRFQIAKM